MYELVMMYIFIRNNLCCNFNVFSDKFNTHAKYSRQFSMGVKSPITFSSLPIELLKILQRALSHAGHFKTRQQFISSFLI